MARADCCLGPSRLESLRLCHLRDPLYVGDKTVATAREGEDIARLRSLAERFAEKKTVWVRLDSSTMLRTDGLQTVRPGYNLSACVSSLWTRANRKSKGFWGEWNQLPLATRGFVLGVHSELAEFV